ncbi:hypothetical protein OH710_08835 [Pseudomonas capsici]|uniref:hypothetical protein n=1 Tax=Pseudomonas capsici TaxID=2810614 RepID=UPI0021F2039A|nr:hypothetical protein [Pseudomonas capsici]MCV4272744.1 hypothetical protein [Pseudomonas capsici]
MPVPEYTAEDLTVLSTVIARAACMTDWKTELGYTAAGATVEEVQIMQVRDSLFIASNKLEHLEISNLFRVFGVTDHSSFLQLIKYCYTLLITEAGRKDKFGKGFDHKFSTQEKETFAYAALSNAKFHTLSDTEINEVKTLITTQSLPTDLAKKRLMWFLKKFVSTTKKYPLHTKMPLTGWHDGVKYTTSEINIVSDSSSVHAELKLLKLLTVSSDENLIKGTVGRVRIGGLKKTCAFCAAWIQRYQPWMSWRHDTRISLPSNDTRTINNGAGQRPGDICNHENLYARTLFNGGVNNLCTDLDDINFQENN